MGDRQLAYREFAFTLPKGLVDAEGNIHRQGRMRPATGKDEILLSQDPRLENFAEYSIFLALSRVITCLGNLTTVTPELLEELFLSDFFYLQQVYSRINQQSRGWLTVGEFLATPWINCIKR